MSEVFSAKELIGLPGMPTTVRGIRIAAQRKGWPSEDRPIRGGREKFYPLSILPEATKAYLLSIYKEQENAQPDRADGVCLDNAAGDNSPSNADVMLDDIGLDLIGEPSQPEQQPEAAVDHEPRRPRQLNSAASSPKRVANADGKLAKRGAKIDAWVAIFKARESWCAAQGVNKQVDCDSAFSEAYLRHEIDLPEEVYETVTRISRATIARKRQDNEKGGVTALAGKEGAGRPK